MQSHPRQWHPINCICTSEILLPLLHIMLMPGVLSVFCNVSYGTGEKLVATSVELKPMRVKSLDFGRYLPNCKECR